MLLKYFIWGGTRDLCKYVRQMDKKVIVAPVTEWCKTDKERKLYLDDLSELGQQLVNQEIAVKGSSYDFTVDPIKNIINEFYYKNKEIGLDLGDEDEKENIWSFDAEESWTKDQYHLMMDELIRYGYGLSVRKCYQAYLKGEWDIMMEDLDEYGDNYCIRLVRGAYHETEIKKKTGAVFENKVDTDHQFRDMMWCLVTECRNPVVIATHNKEDIEWLKNNVSVNSDRVKIGQLLGMGMNISDPRVIKYIPYGSMMDAVPYLSRRLIENKSILRHLI